jgi:hypothetical protein
MSKLEKRKYLDKKTLTLNHFKDELFVDLSHQMTQ